jgi:hypothetical protein
MYQQLFIDTIMKRFFFRLVVTSVLFACGAATLLDFQKGDCFYCRRPLREESAHVDHFVP